MRHETQLRLLDDPMPLLDQAEPDEEYDSLADAFDGEEDVSPARRDFEDYLRQKGWPYVAVDIARRAIFAQPGMDDFDFLVYSELGVNVLVLLVAQEGPTDAEASVLEGWERVFGPDFRACLVTFSGGKWRAMTVQQWHALGWHPVDFDLLA